MRLKRPKRDDGSYDLNGIWRDGDFPVNIEHVGSVVTARWLKVPYLCDPGSGSLTNPTDIDFEATLSGDTLTGETTTCSTSGLTMADMTLRVVEDGDVLDGTWFNPITGLNVPMTLIRCERYLAEKITKGELEDHDRQRWFEGLKQTNADMVSWKWPASFYLDDFNVSSEAWITNSGNFVLVSTTNLQLGDVVIFRGKGPSSRPGQEAIAHSAIATGIDDQVSQLWWSRDVRSVMHENGKIISPPDSALGPQSGGYAITRDKISDLKAEFTDNQGHSYFFDRYEVWRPKNPSGSVPELAEDICLQCPAQHIVKAPIQRSFLRP